MRQAQAVGINCMCETSGKDVAMFHYIDFVFPSSTAYRKLALHFTINDLAHAKVVHICLIVGATVVTCGNWIM